MIIQDEIVLYNCICLPFDDFKEKINITQSLERKMRKNKNNNFRITIENNLVICEFKEADFENITLI